MCKNTAFHQDCFVKMTEIVNVKKKISGELILISRSIADTPDDAEYNNEFQCPECQTFFEIINKDGVDTIVQIGLEEDNG